MRFSNATWTSSISGGEMRNDRIPLKSGTKTTNPERQRISAKRLKRGSFFPVSTTPWLRRIPGYRLPASGRYKSAITDPFGPLYETSLIIGGGVHFPSQPFDSKFKSSLRKSVDRKARGRAGAKKAARRPRVKRKKRRVVLLLILFPNRRDQRSSKIQGTPPNAFLQSTAERARAKSRNCSRDSVSPRKAGSMPADCRACRIFSTERWENSPKRMAFPKVFRR